MNDEPHSHKKVTVVVLALFLLAYVGSYVGLNQNPALDPPSELNREHEDIRLICFDRGNGYFPLTKFLNYFSLSQLFLFIMSKKEKEIPKHCTTNSMVYFYFINIIFEIESV